MIKEERPLKTSEGLQNSHTRLAERITSYTKKKMACSGLLKKIVSMRRKASVSLMYQNIDVMPMHRFVDCLCDENYSSIYVKRLPRRRRAEFEVEHFASLYIDYMERILCGDNSVFAGMKKMLMALSKVSLVEAAMAILANGEIDDESKSVLRSMGIILTGNAQRDMYILLGFRDNALRMFNKARDIYASQIKNDRSQDRGYFMSMFASLSSHFKYPVPFMTTTVGEYCSLYQQMKSNIKAMENHQKNRKNGR